MVLAWVAVGCGSPVAGLPGGDGESTAATGGDPLTVPPGDDTIDGDGPERRDGNFLDPRDGGSTWAQCDQWSQDCPPGDKCMPWSDGTGSWWSAWKCVPIDPDPDALGEPCTFEDDGHSGVDSCAKGTMCWFLDGPDDAVCVGFCQGGEAHPTCADPTAHCVGRDLMVCLPSCCPLEQDCGDAGVCVRTPNAFECFPDASGDPGAFRDPCEFPNACDPGLFCADPDRVPGCQGSIGCCTPYCAVGSASCAAYDPALACVPWFEEGHAPFGEEHIGGCLVPA